MPVKNFAQAPQQLSLFRAQTEIQNIPQHLILILAWNALVVLYGEGDSSPFSVAIAT